MKKTLVAIVCVMGLVFAVTNARAAVITLTQGDLNYVGLIVDGIPSSPANEIGYITTLIAQAPGAGTIAIGTETYNRVGSTLANPLPTPTQDLGRDEDGPFSFTLDFDIPTYILGKYDAEAAGSLVWLLGLDDFEVGDTVTLQATLNDRGLSHISGYGTGTPVPEPGTMMLLGSGLVGLAGWGRKKFRK